MPLKLVCPSCRADVPLEEPLPLPGASIQCASCGFLTAVSYPPGAVGKLKASGKVFAEAQPAPSRPTPRDAPPERFKDGARMGTNKARKGPSAAAPPPRSDTQAATEAFEGRVSQDASTVHALARDAASFAEAEGGPTAIDPTQVAPDDGPRFDEIDRTVPAMRSPYGGLPNNAAEPEGRLPGVPRLDEDPTSAYEDPEDSLGTGTQKGPMATQSKKTKPRRTGRTVKGAVGCVGSMGMFGVGGLVLLVLLGLGVAGGGYWYYSQDLPTVETLRAYRPPTVTVVEDRNGEVLGEIFEQRRYVVPIEEIPQHVKQAFLAAEDANFYTHGGIDYIGIVRAMGRNAAAGRMAQGASTITQQVARNFLLTKDKKLERKIKEVLLSWRIEEAYEKDHILFLYLNEIFLGSQAYGVEAASRTYFGKSVREVSIAEAAILAGLPQRPSDYSPHRGWSKARARQEYVIGQMVAKGYITAEQGAAALNEDVKIVPKGNAFLEQAPWFTEHVRRYLVEKYGGEQVLNQGLRVRTTCDLALQRVAQQAVTAQVNEVDQRMGFRRAAVKNVGKSGIEATRKAHEDAMRQAWAEARDAAGRVPAPERSVLEPGTFVQGVLTEVQPKWARVAIGSHEGLIPLAWSDWVYEPDPARSWRSRTATDLTALVDTDDDGKRDAPILQVGDVVKVRVEALTTREEAVAKAFKGTPGETEALVAARLWQDPEVEAGLISMDLDTGAVRAMVGGADFTRSQFNRAVQARRQVGSTFKPLVYAAAIESKRITAATLVADAPLAMATAEEFVWKPANYSHEYEGNMTLRQALAKSKNTCTVRVLEATDPGMNDDVIYKFARRLGIGGPPTHALPADWVPTPQNDVLCPWIRETPDSTICMDRWPAKDPEISDRQHRAQLEPDDEYWCRACDMSMGLGSASLTMEEMIRAYSPFPTGGLLVQPYTVEEVRDRDGNVLESHTPAPPVQVMDPAVASISTWLLEGVAKYGTGAAASVALKLEGIGGKTGTTNDEKDAWFVGFTNDVITAVWVGYDQPRTLGVSSTGGRTALPIWIDYMREAAPKSKDRPFLVRGEIDYAMIDESNGRRVTSGGVRYPFLKDTAPEGSGLKAGQVSIEDLGTEL